jgi:hypothetical protein
MVSWAILHLEKIRSEGQVIVSSVKFSVFVPFILSSFSYNAFTLALIGAQAAISDNAPPLETLRPVA